MSTEKTPFEAVREFHEIFKHPVRTEGVTDMSKESYPDDLLLLRLNLVMEEVIELIDATLGSTSASVIENAWENAQAYGHSVDGDFKRDIVETVDALADIEYVLQGFALTLGVNLPEVIREVHDSNMSKLENGKPIYHDGTLAPVGKVKKGKNFRAPDIARVLREQKPL